MEPIKYVGLDETTGYGNAAKTLVAALRREGAEVHWVPVHAGRNAWKPSSVPQVTEGYAGVILHWVPEYYPCWIEFERSLRREPGRIWGYTPMPSTKWPTCSG